MEKIGLNQLREMFEAFYVKKEHYPRGSFPLIPEKDKSLLIINSGMAPLKPYFAGLETPPSKRMTTCQKCIRTGDIENVGYTSRHGTFFEMLGSFSFGDYFKKESLLWGWEFITRELKMPVERLWATVYTDDREAYDIWTREIGLPAEKVVRLGKEDNFWEIGTGPCGPCSEIYFDRGEACGCGDPACKPGCDCDRYVEFWNHVFTQFNRDEEGNYTPLAHPNIDTGMGLERLACIMQEVDSIFDVDTIRYILNAVVERSGVSYQNGAAPSDVSIRIITDHIRSVSFMISDGILPGNEGRGYVLRRLLRRAARHGKLLGIRGTFLAGLSAKVAETSGSAYPGLLERQEYIRKIIAAEEEKFAATIDQGVSIISEYAKQLAEQGSTVLDGALAFKLYDTYGFPLELTQEILKEQGFTADEEGFLRQMENQRETARAARKSHEEAGWSEDGFGGSYEGSSLFTGYDTIKEEAAVLAVFSGAERVPSASAGETVRVVLDRTPFYAESGGQASDRGRLAGEGFSADVTEVSRHKDAVFHKITITEGTLNEGRTVTAAVDAAARNRTARNHTATHLLHRALRLLVGEHVQQAGSAVTEAGLRFDFTHFEGVSKETLRAVEDLVNEKIIEFLPVTVEELSLEDAVKEGATALFDEKYGDRVRVVSVGGFSKELCGGTHVSDSGQIGAFRILSEGGVAAGIRRIEAVTGSEIRNLLIREQETVQTAAAALKTAPANLIFRIQTLSEELKAARKALEEQKHNAISAGKDALLAEAVAFSEGNLIIKSLPGYSAGDLRSLSDDLKAAQKGLILVLAAENEGKVSFLVSVTDDLTEKGYHAGNLIKQIAAAAGGSGGGKADMAQAGAKDPRKIQDAFDTARKLIS